MDKIMNKLYYMIDEWAGQQYEMDEGTKGLEERREELRGEVIRRLDEGGEELLEEIADVELMLETIHDKALFRAAVRLGTELAGKPSGEAPAVDAACVALSGT